MTFSRFSISLCIAALCACSAFPTHLEPPQLAVAGISDVRMGLLEQRLTLSIHLTNPNNVALQLNGLTLQVELDGNHFANASSTATTALPALGQVDLPLQVIVNTNDLLKVVQSIRDHQESRMGYRLTGEAIIEPFGRHVAIDRNGTLSVPPALLR